MVRMMDLPDDVVIRQTPHRWYLRTTTLYPESHPFLNWLDFLPSGFGTKHQREYLTRSTKEFLAAWIRTSVGYGGLSHNTLEGHFFRLRSLARWMVERGIWRPAQLSVDDMADFLRGRLGRNGKIASATMHEHIALFQKLWLLRSEYCGALRVNPVGLPGEVQRLHVGTRCARPWKPLNESVALQIIKKALAIIERHGDYVGDAMLRLWKLRDRMVGATRGQKTAACRRLCEQMSKERGFQEMRLAITNCPAGPYLALQRAVSLIESACVTALLFLVGQRSVELVRMDSGCLRTNGEPTDALFYLEGVAAKRARPKRWVVSHPVPSIIRVLEKMYEPSRDASGARALLLVRRGTTVFPPSRGKKVERWTANAVNSKFKYFIKTACRDLKVNPIRVHSHMGRKTFAKFVALRDKHALESLAFHFGHVYRYITDTNYVGVGFQLAELIGEESRKDLASGLTDLLSSRRIGGKAGAALESLRAEVQTKFRGKLALSKLVDRLIEDGVQLAPCDWGYCVFCKPLSACGGTSSGPNEAKRSPEICSGCLNFSVTPAYEGWWQARREREAAFLNRSSLPGQVREVVERRLRNTDRILQELGHTSDENAGKS